jgi:hypothetical protein
MNKIWHKTRHLLALVAATFVAVPAFAQGTGSPFGVFITNVAAEATSSWAVGGAIAALVVGCIGAAFGQHEIKTWAVRMCIVCVAMLSIQGTIAWLT